MKNLLVFFSMLCFLITSCSSFNNRPNKPPLEFDPAYLNQQIKLIAPQNMSAFKTNEVVSALLKANSTNEIVVPSNYKLRLFIQQDTQWLEIKEAQTIRPEDPIILSPSATYQSSIMFWPKLDDLTKTYNMRVYIFGDMKTQEGIKQVAAFTDFILTPP